jgi:hypothetical protein
MFEVPFFDSDMTFESMPPDSAVDEIKPEPKRITINMTDVIISHDLDLETFKIMLACALAT